MERTWYRIAKQCTSLRKHVLRIDPCIFVDDEAAFSSTSVMNSTIKSILTAAIIKGLDVVGILSNKSSNVGWIAYQMAKQQQMDIAVLPGQTYICTTGEEIYIYKIKQPLPKNLTLPKACEAAHKMGGFVIITNLTKQKVRDIEKLKGSTYAPDAVELFNAKSGGYHDFEVDLPAFISSAATSANSLEDSNAFTLLERSKAEEMGLLAPNEGEDFEPKYLKPKMDIPNA
jgi:hypothetical protein